MATHPALPEQDEPGTEPIAPNPSHLPVEPDFPQPIPPSQADEPHPKPPTP